MKQPTAEQRKIAALQAENRTLKAEICHLRIRLMKGSLNEKR